MTSILWTYDKETSPVARALNNTAVVVVAPTSESEGLIPSSLAGLALKEVAARTAVAAIIEPETIEAFAARRTTPAAAAVGQHEYLQHVVRQIGDPFVKLMAAGHPHVLLVVASQTLAENPLARQVLISDVGVHMVVGTSAASQGNLLHVLGTLANPEHRGKLKCPICKKADLSPKGMYVHLPQFHGNTPFRLNTPTRCPSCAECSSPSAIVNHYFHEHPPEGPPIPERIKVSLYTFSLVVTRRRRDGKFLMVQEFCDQGFWLPGGGVDPGECPIAGGRRETLEEAGVKVEIKGILNINMQPGPKLTRLTFIFYAEPIDDDAEAKAIPDFESVGAAWVGIDELSHLNLRGKEPLKWFPYVANGGEVHPLSLLQIYPRR